MIVKVVMSSGVRLEQPVSMSVAARLTARRRRNDFSTWSPFLGGVFGSEVQGVIHPVGHPVSLGFSTFMQLAFWNSCGICVGPADLGAQSSRHAVGGIYQTQILQVLVLAGPPSFCCYHVCGW